MDIVSKADIFNSPSLLMLDSLPLPTILVDTEGRIAQVNQLVCELLEEEAGHLIGSPFLRGSWLLIRTDNSVLEAPEELLVSSPQDQEAINGVRIGLILKKNTVWLSFHAKSLFSEENDYQGSVVTFVDVTTNTNAELKASRQASRLLSVPEHQTNYIIRTDLEGNFLYLNQAARVQFDREDEDEDVFRSLNYLTDPKYAISCIKAAAYCIDHPGSYRHIEIRCYNNKREYFWTAWDLVGITDDTGDVVEIQAVGHDISQKKRMADLLGETSQMARIGGWEISSFSKQVSWTPETYRIHDVAEGTRISMRRVIQFFHEEHQPIIRRAYRELISNGEPFDLSLKLHTAQRRELWVRVIGQRESVHGNFVRAYGVIQDITESQLSKERIKHREWLFQSVFNSTADALFIIDQERRVINCNQSALRILEIDQKEDVLGVDATSFQKDPFTKEEVTSIRKAIDETGLWTSEVEFVSTKSRVFWGSLAITTFPEMGYGVVRITDITDKKKAEALLLESNQHLTKANQELDRFVYSASHDLRAPLTSILGLISLAETENGLEEVQGYLQHMKKSAHRLDAFIKDLIYFSRNARMEVTAEPIDFNDLIGGIFEQYQFMDHEVPVKTSLEVNQHTTFFTDQSRLHIVLGNIISNAMKYRMNRRDAESYVKVGIEVNQEEAIIRVEDNGIGIPSAHQSKIFEMFYRADDHKPGSGLGLYIVKETIEKLKGSIKVRSSHELGTEFTLHLPQLPLKS
ncbi:PAS domain-containing sensor histidine kinase [Tunicatimonas pelagia]|uniref:PAS domain-containing sensor histidine kinase n=1 Tax=Tunicatimonas pelagia TaxID=931531 RepID=UPI002665EC59|nr:PAS domain-containing sensor histidine kinase [Tunicatimonas pelagia]WKN41184.1 PAS domain-containing sensor histidine kinase [Tunicatimonas pelagia]